MTEQTAAWIWPVMAGAIVALTAMVPYVRTNHRRTVFVSYRRQDSAAYVRQIAERLTKRFGKGIFVDTVSITPGNNFRQEIAGKLGRCDAALIVIGPLWKDCVNSDGARRLDDPEDIVRGEVASALDSGALVIPLLVGGSAMPRQQELPPDLHALADLQAVSIDQQRFDESLPPVINAIARSPVRRTPALVVISHLAVLVLLVVSFLAEGLLLNEFTTLLAIAAPLFAATSAVALKYASTGLPHRARVRQVPASSLLVPMTFVSALGALVVMKTLNFGIRSAEVLKLSFATVELIFGAYTGLVLASLFEDRRDA